MSSQSNKHDCNVWIDLFFLIVVVTSWHSKTYRIFTHVCYQTVKQTNRQQKATTAALKFTTFRRGKKSQSETQSYRINSNRKKKCSFFFYIHAVSRKAKRISSFQFRWISRLHTQLTEKLPSTPSSSTHTSKSESSCGMISWIEASLDQLSCRRTTKYQLEKVMTKWNVTHQIAFSVTPTKSVSVLCVYLSN